MASELVTNAVQAGGRRPAGRRGVIRARSATIRVRVLVYQAGIVIEVWDRDPGSPVRQRRGHRMRRAAAA